MRLGRSVAALGASAALAVAGAGLAAPAAADVDSNTFALEAPFRIDPAAETVTVTGTGCLPVDGKESTVLVVLTSAANADAGRVQPVAVQPTDDGSWTATVPVAASIAADGASPVDDDWGIAAACLNYAGDQVATDATDILLDTTPIDESYYTISGDTVGAQTITVEGSGWTEGKTVTISLAVIDGAEVAQLGTATPDAQGTFSFSTTLPQVADGTYELRLQDTRGEGGASTKAIVVTNGLYTNADRDDDNNNGAMTGSDPAAGAAAVAVPAATATSSAKPAAAAGRGELARTGADTMAAIVVAGGLIAGGIILAARRRKA